MIDAIYGKINNIGLSFDSLFLLKNVNLFYIEKIINTFAF